MFFLRCAFFLSIVYSSMSWTDGTAAKHGPFAGPEIVMRGTDAGRVMTEQVVQRAVAGVSDFCGHHAAECLADAARLSSLVAATAPDGATASGRQTPRVSASRPRDAARIRVVMPATRSWRARPNPVKVAALAAARHALRSN